MVPCVAGLLAAFVVTPSPAAEKAATSQQPKLWALGVSAGNVSSVKVEKLQWLRRRGIQALVVNASALSPKALAKVTDRAAHSGMLVIAGRGSLRPGACPGPSSTLRTCAVIAQTPREAVRLTRLNAFDYVVYYVHNLRQVNYLRGVKATHTQLLAIVPPRLVRADTRRWKSAATSASGDSALNLTIRTAPAASRPVMLNLLKRWSPRFPRPHAPHSPTPTGTTTTTTTPATTTSPSVTNAGTTTTPPTTTPPPTTTTSPPPTTTTPPPTTTTPPPTTTTADTQPPNAPQGLTVTGSSQTSVSVSWSASNDNVGVSGYDVYRNGTSVGTTSATSRTFSSLACGTSYTLGVDAFDAAGNKSVASTISASTAACPDTQAPTVPTGLTVTSSTTTSVSVSWGVSFDNVAVTGYDVYNGSTVAGTTGTFTVYTVSGLTCGTSYTLAVDAFDAAGNKSTKTSVTTSTAACADTQAPTTPTGLLVTGSTTNSVSISWSAAFDNVAVTGYDVYKGTTVAGTTSTFTNYTVSGLTCGTSYTVAVDAFDAAGNKSAKNSLTTSTAACPTSLASVTFNSPAAGATVSGSIVWAVQPTVAFDHVDFIIDGGAVGWTERSCPCYYNGDPDGRLDTTTLSNSSHTLTAKAYNSSGTEVAESSESVTVNNAAAPPPTTTTPTPTPAPTTCTSTINSGLQLAITNAPAGSVICLNSGTYQGFTLSNVSKSTDVTIQPASGATVTISPGIDFNVDSHLRFTGIGGTLSMQGASVDQSDSCSSHLTLDHITFTDGVNVLPFCTNMAILVDHDTFDNLGINTWEGRVNVQAMDVGPSSPVGVTISNSHFGGGCSDGIDVLGGAYGVQIVGNEFTGIKQSGCDPVHADPIALYGASHTLVSGNYFHDNGDGSGGLMMGWDGDFSTVTNNVFVCDCIYPYSVFAGATHNSVYEHNTFAGGGLIRFEVVNGVAPSGDVIGDNVFTAGGGISLDSSSSGYGSNNHNLNANQSGSGDISGAPVFVGGAHPTSYAGYALVSGSPGTGAASDGTNLGIGP